MTFVYAINAKKSIPDLVYAKEDIEEYYFNEGQRDERVLKLLKTPGYSRITVKTIEVNG